MKKKNLILILLFIICCGCNARYELELNDKQISEKLNVSYPRTNESDAELEQIYTNYLYAINRDSFYEFNNKSTNDTINLQFNYDYKNNNLKTSNLIKSCVEYFDFFEEDNKFYLTANGAFKCSFYEYVKLNSLDISITTNHNVIENNANEVKNGEYIWHIDLKNLENIEIKFITDNKESKQWKKEKNKIKYKEILIGLGSAAGIIILVTLFIAIKHKRVNKI